jgi:hypothetical protein
VLIIDDPIEELSPLVPLVGAPEEPLPPEPPPPTVIVIGDVGNERHVAVL